MPVVDADYPAVLASCMCVTYEKHGGKRENIKSRSRYHKPGKTHALCSRRVVNATDPEILQHELSSRREEMIWTAVEERRRAAWDFGLTSAAGGLIILFPQEAISRAHLFHHTHTHSTAQGIHQL